MMRHNKIIIACSSLPFAQDIENKISIHNSIRVSISQNDKELHIQMENDKTALVLIEDSFYKNITAHIIGTFRDKYPDIRFAVFTFREMEPDELDNFYTLAAPSSFINLRLGSEECIKGIDLIVTGNDYMPEFMINNLSNKQISPLVKTTLTKREMSVMVMLVDGYNPSHIATALGITQGTVRIHKSHIYEKCGVHNQFDLMKFAKTLKNLTETKRHRGF